MKLSIIVMTSLVHAFGYYTGIGILSYNFVAPVFDQLSGPMPPCLLKYVAYGVLWPIPVSALIYFIAHELFNSTKEK